MFIFDIPWYIFYHFTFTCQIVSDHRSFNWNYFLRYLKLEKYFEFIIILCSKIYYRIILFFYFLLVLLLFLFHFFSFTLHSSFSTYASRALNENYYDYENCNFLQFS